MAANRTFNQIYDVFRYIAENHVFINSFSFVTELHEIAASTDTLYPALIVMPEGATTESNLLHYKFNIIVADLVHKDESNENEVLSDTLQTLLDIKAWLTNNQCNGFTLKKESTITPFTERWDDEVSGHVGNFELEIWNTDSLCALPGLVPCSGSNGLTNIDTTSPCSQIGCLSAGTISVNNFYISGDTIYEYIDNYFYNIVSGVTNGTNIGSGTGEVYKNKLNNQLRFRTLSAGTFIDSITTETNTVTINAAEQPDTYWISGQTGNFSVMRKLPYGGGQHYCTTNYSTIAGGKQCFVSGAGGGYSFIGNGFYHSIVDNSSLTQHSIHTTILNGHVNRINNVAYNNNASYASILGGNINSNNANFGLIGNGQNNLIYSGRSHSILNGSNCLIRGSNYGAIINGESNKITGNASTILNGSRNYIYGTYTTVGGGKSNHIGNLGYQTSQNYSLILGGNANNIYISHSGETATRSSILNGSGNKIVASNRSSINNGANNTITTYNYSTINNGYRNSIVGKHSIIDSGIYNTNYGHYSSIISSKSSSVSLQVPRLERAVVCGMDSYIANSGGTFYTEKVLARSLSGSSFRVVVADAEGLLSTTSAISVTGSSSSITYKASAVTNTLFALSGGEYKYTVTFPAAFSNTNYSIQLTGQDERDWTYESKLAGSFIINSHSSVALTGSTDWFCIAYN